MKTTGDGRPATGANNAMRLTWESIILHLRNPFRISYGVSETRRAFWLRLGGWQMIHASRLRNGVYVDDVQQPGWLHDNFRGARAFA